MNLRAIPRQRFIPFSLYDVEGICRQYTTLDEQDFETHRQLFANLINHDFQSLHNQLKNAYRPFNPDRDTKVWQQLAQDSDSLSDLVVQVLTAANYEQLTTKDLELAMLDNSLCQIKLDIDFNEFSRLLVFTRGEHIERKVIGRFGRFGKKTVEFVSFERVFIFLQFQDEQWFKRHKRVIPEQIKPGTIMLKLFKEVPKADLETLFPNTKVRMRNRDKLLIGVPAIASGGVILATKLGATLLLVGALISFYMGWSKEPVVLDQKNLLILAAGLATLGGYFWKQFSAFKNKKIRFMQTLSASLYYKALDNNAGVFHYLIDSAKESECKELLLAWTFMQRLQHATAQELDQAIEDYFLQEHDTTIDFDVPDALAKLLRWQMVTQMGDEYIVCDPKLSYQHLITQWQRAAIE